MSILVDTLLCRYVIISKGKIPRSVKNHTAHTFKILMNYLQKDYANL